MIDPAAELDARLAAGPLVHRPPQPPGCTSWCFELRQRPRPRDDAALAKWVEIFVTRSAAEIIAAVTKKKV